MALKPESHLLSPFKFSNFVELHLSRPARIAPGIGCWFHATADWETPEGPDLNSPSCEGFSPRNWLKNHPTQGDPCRNCGDSSWLSKRWSEVPEVPTFCWDPHWGKHRFVYHWKPSSSLGSSTLLYSVNLLWHKWHSYSKYNLLCNSM